jgi:hypothetical protein
MAKRPDGLIQVEAGGLALNPADMYVGVPGGGSAGNRAQGPCVGYFSKKFRVSGVPSTSLSSDPLLCY